MINLGKLTKRSSKFQPLMTSLTFQESAGLVEGAMNSILQLIPTLADEQSKEFHNKLERVITDGILSGLTYAKSENTGTIQVPYLRSLLLAGLGV